MSIPSRRPLRGAPRRPSKPLRLSRSGLLAGLLACTAGLAAACNGDVVSDHDYDAALTLHGDGGHVRYLLGYSWEGATWDEAAAGYRFTSDEGVEVLLTGLWVGVGALELVPCEPEEEDAPTESTVAALLRELLLAGRARADHAWVSDGTLVEQPTVIDALAGRLVEFGGGTTTAGSAYCGLYQRAIVLQQGASADLVRQSLRATGTYLLPGDSADKPFDVSVDLLVGTTDTLHRDPESAWLPGATDVLVTYAGHQLFDGVDPNGLSDRELAYELLRNAITAGTVSVRLPGSLR